jgi:hypothetical protein
VTKIESAANLLWVGVDTMDHGSHLLSSHLLQPLNPRYLDLTPRASSVLLDLLNTHYPHGDSMRWLVLA